MPVQMFGDAVIGELNLKMIEVARAVGAAAKFAGSGGACVVLPHDDTQVRTLLAPTTNVLPSEPTCLREKNSELNMLNSFTCSKNKGRDAILLPRQTNGSFSNFHRHWLYRRQQPRTAFTCQESASHQGWCEPSFPWLVVLIQYV